MTTPEAHHAHSGQRLFVNAAKSSVQGPEPECGQAEERLASPGACPVVGEAANAVREADCPVISPDFDPSNLMPRTPNRPAPGQTTALSSERVASSIPTAADTRPQHQDAASNVWVYPSEQMFYNAMKRKGWQPSERDMGTVVSIHNAVNERAWSEVLMWEQLHCNKCKAVKLKKFMGRPKDHSPKARILHLMGYKLPFDRHDWVVDRCGQDIRYVIDFYNAAPLPGMPVALHLDVRPALDSFEAVWDRIKVQANWTISGRWLGEQQRAKH